MKRYILLIILGIGLAFGVVSLGLAQVDIPGGTKLGEVSIGSDEIKTTVDKNSIKNFGFQLLNLGRIAVSGLALIYIVLMGAYMVIFSDNESVITKQKKQLVYVLVAFLFLNLPSMVYDVMIGSGTRIARGPIGEVTQWSLFSTNSVFWSSAGLTPILGGIINFLRVFVYGIAILVLAWGAFSLIFGSSQDDARKKAQTRFIYGILGIIFMGFVDMWGITLATSTVGDFIQKTGSSVVGIAIYFAAPVAVFFLILGGYYMITSAGDDARIKKGKNIVINTLIAAIILIASLSFLVELTSFNFNTNP